MFDSLRIAVRFLDLPEVDLMSFRVEYVKPRSGRFLGRGVAERKNKTKDFSESLYCPLSRVLHVTLANWQKFGFEFHLRSSPSAFSGFVNISQPAAYFTACYTC